MSFLILLFPFLSAVLCFGLGASFLGTTGVSVLAPMFLCMTCIVAFYTGFVVLINEVIIYLDLGICLDAFGYELTWALQFDPLTVIMVMVVSCISCLVHFYAVSYMSEDPYLVRFLATLSLFTFFMLVLITTDNYFQLFVGWEGVGLCSYLLITFWFTRISANKAAIQALVVNKVGDYFLALATALLLSVHSTTNFSVLFLNAVNLNELDINIGGIFVNFLDLIGFMLVIAASAKSAQIGLHTWLLSAMEGPTPVSALLHAATMVTAGVFLLLRSSFIIELLPNILWLITLIGATTAFFAGTCGLVQHDLKKIIAFSTCSQLGYMFYACGLSQYASSLFHLTNHAFFKALLFLCAGAIIHALGGEQDLRRMGGLVRIMPVTYLSMMVASLALMGFPFLSGFYSKDRILEMSWGTSTSYGYFVFLLTTAAAACTAIYSWRLLYWVFLSNSNTYKLVMQRAVEADESMLFVFRVLLLGSLFSGFFFKDAFIGFGGDFLKESVSNFSNVSVLMESEFIPVYIKLLPFFCSTGGALLALMFYSSSYYITLVKWQMYSFTGNLTYKFLVKKWYFDRLYNYYIADFIYLLGKRLYFEIDQGYTEWVGPQGFSYLIDKFGFFSSKLFRIRATSMVSGSFVAALLFFLISF